ncbi:MAG: hypothetical protein K2G36_01955 [Ruminococcus sp.]|nr:hypothetical protein [Ruminococcus sp.]
MNNFRKRIIAIVSLACVSLTMITGCAGNDESGDNSGTLKNSNNSGESSQLQDIEPITAVPFKWGGQDEDTGLTIDGVDINVDDPVKADHVDPTKATEESEAETTAKPVTTAYIAGEPITEFVPVTEANGEAVTDAVGQPVTEVKIIANAMPETDNSVNNTAGDNVTDNNNTENSTPDENAQNPESTEAENNQNPEQTPTNAPEATSEYVSNTKGMYAMWIDISKNENFVFNGSVIKVTFKVKEDAPDGIYNISLNPDLSSIDGVTINPDTILNGSIKVGEGPADNVDPSTMNGYAVYGDNLTAQQGDTVEFSINMKDNPGLAALVIWYYYDSNALEVVNCVPDGEFAEVSKNSTQTGEQAE